MSEQLQHPARTQQCPTLQAVLQALPAEQRDTPFVAALTEPATLQAAQRGFVILPEWAEILDRHFPPAQP
ncbi:hypothetical protein AB0J28_21750 [Streptosporangium canum]|uniref:hypothetical protein n=1 Tax=Streptosporangium canum TaxID=324952 RepID=UPI00341C4727